MVTVSRLTVSTSSRGSALDLWFFTSTGPQFTKRLAHEKRSAFMSVCRVVLKILVGYIHKLRTSDSVWNAVAPKRPRFRTLVSIVNSDDIAAELRYFPLLIELLSAHVATRRRKSIDGGKRLRDYLPLTLGGDMKKHQGRNYSQHPPTHLQMYWPLLATSHRCCP
jgi:hypothetical protein